MRVRAFTFALVVVVGVATMASAAEAAIRITKIQYDPPGTDTGSNSHLNKEFVVLKNTGSSAVTLTDWTLRDTSSHVYRFDTFRLGAGNSVTIHTGRGNDDRNDLYWDLAYIWNNDGDTATLKDGNGHSRTWS